MSQPTPSPAAPASAVRGGLAAASCYLMWGLVPLYWTRLASIHPLELIAHRHVWSLAFVAAVVLAQRKTAAIRSALTHPGSLATHFVSACLLTANWLVYVWGVNTGRVIETSLGYFLVPLVNVAAGRFLLHEHLRRLQWIAIASAALGVLLMVAQIRNPPWIALILATTWSSYGLLRKRSPLGSLDGLTVETLLLAPLAIGFLLWRHHTGEGALGRVDPTLHVLVLSAGLVTAIPLLLFAYGARRIRLSTLGLLQYLGPTVQFALGLLVYHETFSADRAIGFAFIWIGLAIYTLDGFLTQRATR